MGNYLPSGYKDAGGNLSFVYISFHSGTPCNRPALSPVVKQGALGREFEFALESKSSPP